MRRALVPAGVLVVVLAACTRERANPIDDAGPAAPSAPSSSASSSSSAPEAGPAALPGARPSPVVLPAASSASAPPIPGPHVVGSACSPGRDSIACTPDGLEALTCASGQWRMLQSCRGPGHCAGVGSALTCDTGLPQPGDSCVPATSEPHCRNPHESIACQGGKWMVSPCGPGTLCSPGAGKGHAGCK